MRPKILWQQLSPRLKDLISDRSYVCPFQAQRFGVCTQPLEHHSQDESCPSHLEVGYVKSRRLSKTWLVQRCMAYYGTVQGYLSRPNQRRQSVEKRGGQTPQHWHAQTIESHFEDSK